MGNTADPVILCTIMGDKTQGALNCPGTKHVILESNRLKKNLPLLPTVT